MRCRVAFFGLLAAIPLCAMGAPAAQEQVQYAQRCDTNIRIVNSSSSPVTRIFYNPSTNSNWGPNRLPGAVLRPGQGTVFRLATPEPYDFRIVWQGNAAAEMRSTNICQIHEVVITNDGLRVR